MPPEMYESSERNDSIQSDNNLQNLIKQIDEIKDTIKENDKIEGVFTETAEGQFIQKTLNQGLKESLYKNPTVGQTLIEKINELLNDSSLQLDGEIRNDLVSLRNHLKETIQIKNFEQNAEDIEDSCVSIEFIKSLSIDDVKSLFTDGSLKELKRDLIKEDSKGKSYIIVKGERFNIGIYSSSSLSTHINDNLITYDKKGYIILGNANCSYEFYAKDNVITIDDGETEVKKYGNGENLVTYNDNGKKIRSANGIKVRGEEIADGDWRYCFHSKNGDLVLSLYKSDETFLKITSILSKMKNTNMKCEKLDRSTLKLGDTTYKFEFVDDIDNIKKWINNYYN